MDDDLGALLSRLLRVVADREAPILERHRLSMWEYVILTPLLGTPGLSQNELAVRSRRDPTRLIGHLDDLAARGLIDRVVDGADRRRRLVRLTDDGSALLRATRADIRAMEADLLGGLAESAQREFRELLAATLERANR